MTSWWNQEQTVKLIEEVNERPVLWDVMFSEYKNHNKKWDALQEVANALQTSVEEAEKKLGTWNLNFGVSTKHCVQEKSGSVDWRS